MLVATTRASGLARPVKATRRLGLDPCQEQTSAMGGEWAGSTLCGLLPEPQPQPGPLRHRAASVSTLAKSTPQPWPC